MAAITTLDPRFKKGDIVLSKTYNQTIGIVRKTEIIIKTGAMKGPSGVAELLITHEYKVQLWDNPRGVWGTIEATVLQRDLTKVGSIVEIFGEELYGTQWEDCCE